MNKIVYKVVYPSTFIDDVDYNGPIVKYFSACSRKCSLSYNIGQKTVPPGDSKIFCFNSFENALIFRSAGDKIMIGIGENPKGIRMACNWSSDFNFFWKRHKNKKSTAAILRINLPKGSIIVDSFTPEKFVEPGELDE